MTWHIIDGMGNFISNFWYPCMPILGHNMTTHQPFQQFSNMNINRNILFLKLFKTFLNPYPNSKSNQSKIWKLTFIFPLLNSQCYLFQMQNRISECKIFDHPRQLPNCSMYRTVKWLRISAQFVECQTLTTHNLNFET